VVDRIVEPSKIGLFRTTSVVIKNEDTGQVILRPPQFMDVPFLLGEFLVWLNSPVARETHPILRAGIAHYLISAIHPFIEGNGRTARSFANLVLIKDGFDIKKFFALEEHFDADPGAYYQAFSEVDMTADAIFDRDLTAWLVYFTHVVATELAKIKEKVKRLSLDSRLKLKIGRQIPLSERQMRIVEYITDQGGVGMLTLKSVLRMVSEDTILRDVRDLVDKGILKKQGSTKAARYVLASK
jgi:Fic family protein